MIEDWRRTQSVTNSGVLDRVRECVQTNKLYIIIYVNVPNKPEGKFPQVSRSHVRALQIATILFCNRLLLNLKGHRNN